MLLSITARVYSHEFEAAAQSEQRRARLGAIYGAEAFSAASRATSWSSVRARAHHCVERS
jgi:hypothetical protein